jgi:hypothetical protein
MKTNANTLIAVRKLQPCEFDSSALKPNQRGAFMKSFLVIGFLLLLQTQSVHAENVFRIEIGKDFRSYTQSDLQRRVWELERAVAQLQIRVFELEVKPIASPTVDTWSCTVNAQGTSFSGTGGSKAVASSVASEKCRKEARDAFFCGSPECSQ